MASVHEAHAAALLDRVAELNMRPLPPLELLDGGVVRCGECGWRGVPSASGCPVCMEAPATDLLWDLERLERAMTRPAQRRPFVQRENVPQVGRNEPCPCGSGRKYKKCCGG
jgi:hypothetical protein